MLIINLYAPPGSGKSTGAAYVFAMLKMNGINAELITEYAKDKAWENNTEAIDNQVYIFGQQYYRITRCENKVDVIVTDSPLLLSALYNHSEILGEKFNELVAEIAKSYNTINYYINRVKPYNPAGRFQSEEESLAMDRKLRDLLDRYNIIYDNIDGCEEGYQHIVNDILCRLT